MVRPRAHRFELVGGCEVPICGDWAEPPFLIAAFKHEPPVALGDVRRQPDLVAHASFGSSAGHASQYASLAALGRVRNYLPHLPFEAVTVPVLAVRHGTKPWHYRGRAQPFGDYFINAWGRVMTSGFSRH